MARRGVGLGTGFGALWALAGLFSWSGAVAAEALAPSGPELSRSSSTPQSEQSPKVLNRTLFAPPDGMEAGEQIFLTSDMRKPLVGACEMVPADAGYVEEMLVNIESIGSPGGKTYQRRVAFVVGNGAYPGGNELSNPKNDATSMAKLMHLLGFDVYYAADVKEEALETCLEKFRADLERKTADVALFFYAGHGVQLTSQSDNEKRNYMLSVDARVDASGKGYGFKQIDAVLNEMRANARQSVFLYDACRSAPKGVTANITEADGGPVSRQGDLEGAANVEVTKTDASSAPQLFIAYATSPGKTADDSWGPEGSRHSPFTQALLEHLPEPGITIDQALALAFNKVGERTNWKQTPWTSSSVTAQSLEKQLQLNGNITERERRNRVADHAARSAQYREQGLRGMAIAEALKGLLNTQKTEPRMITFPRIMATLSRAYETVVSIYLTDGDDYRRESSYAASFSPNGRVVAIRTPRIPPKKIKSGERIKFLGGMKFVDASTGETTSAIVDFGLYSAGVSAFAPDSTRIAISRGGGVEVWNVKSASQELAFGGHEGLVRAIYFSQDGDLVFTGSDDETVRIWDARTGALRKAIQGNGDKVFDLALSKDGKKLLTNASFESSGRLWDVNTGRQIVSLAGHGGATLSVALSPDESLIATGSTDGNVRFWDAKTGSKIGQVALNENAGGSSEQVREVTFSPDGFVLIAASRSKIVSLSIEHRENQVFIRSKDRLEPTGEFARFSEDGSALLVGGNLALRIVPQPNRVELARNFSVREKNITTGEKIDLYVERSVVGDDIVWNARSGRRLFVLEDAANYIREAISSPTGILVATISSDDIVRLWDVRKNYVVGMFGWKRERIVGSAFSPDGRSLAIATSMTDYEKNEFSTTLRVFDLASLEMRIARTFDIPAHSVVFADNGTEALILGYGDKGRLVRLDVDSVREFSVGIFAGSAGFSIDGHRFVICGSGQVWDTQSMELIARLEPSSRASGACGFLADGERIFDTASMNRIDLWDSNTGFVVNSIVDVGDPAISADGETAYFVRNDIASFRKLPPYGIELIESSYSVLTEKLKLNVERERVRYWTIESRMFD